MEEEVPHAFEELDEKTNITQQFAPKVVSASDREATAKELFMGADLIVPEIALKKMKQAVKAADAEARRSYFAVMGEATATMYRMNRPSVSKLVMADMSKHEVQF